MVPADSKNRILNSAEAVVLRDGVARLTLDAVAAEVGLSKGGVLYHYPSKDALVRGMVERLIDQTEAEINKLAAADPEPRGRVLRSYVRVTFPEDGTAPARVNQLAAVLLTAILTNPNLVEPIRNHFGQMQRRLLADGLDEKTVHIVRLASDGLWLSEMLQMPGPEKEIRDSVIRRLYEMTRK